MKQYKTKLKQIAFSLLLGVFLGVNSLSVSADEACTPTDTTGSIYGNIIDTCDTSITETDLITIAVVTFAFGVAILAAQQIYSRLELNN